MKFLVDAHLPPRLCAVLQAAGHEATHTAGLAARNQTPDEIINQVSLAEMRVVVTKDTDFYHSHLLHGKPWKLLLVRTGNISTRDLNALFARHLPAIVAAFETNSLVEVDRQTVQVML
jgi:predicted nuclease of predicted toxin-antitoxin system